jgi:transcriptional regulator with PAS, ATPase and Fis domain
MNVMPVGVPCDMDGSKLASMALAVAPSGSVSAIRSALGPDCDVIYRSDERGITREVGDACEDLWGFKPRDLEGRSVFDLERDGIYKPSVTRLVLETGHVIQSLQSTRTGRRLLVVGIPVRSKSGDIAQVVNLSWNITTKASCSAPRNGDGFLKIHEGASCGGLDGFVFGSAQMARVADIALKVSAVDSTVLITGESGVGKEVVASFLHSRSKRGGGPFIKINCAAIPEELLESELFGYERGAFTGANRGGKPGVFDLAEKGTLLLDEISETSKNMQAKLLRVLQDGSFMRVGGTKPVRADVRIIAAANRDLEREMREGRFRQDLFYRLNVVPIHIPPLRERPDDIPLLAMHFLKHYNARYGKNKIFDARTIMRFQEHDWRGNIRELQNAVERLTVLTEGDLIVAPDFLGDRQAENAGVTVGHIMPLRDAVNAVERQIIRMAMEKFGTATKAAEVLGVDQSTISRKMKKI